MNKTENTNALPAICTIPISSPITWLKLGWQDLANAKFSGVFYGAVFVLMGYAIVWIYATRWQLTMALIGGFFLMGPFLCTGLYDLSRQLERNNSAKLTDSLFCWRKNPASIAFFAIILTFAMIVWARVSVILFALSSTTNFPTPQGVLKTIFSLQNPGFLLLWSGVGFIFASLVFAIGVVSVPMLLDRRADTMMAIFTSVRAVHRNPVALYFWAALVVLVIGLSLLAGFFPLLITAPIVGHASWHAYRDLVQQKATT